MSKKTFINLLSSLFALFILFSYSNKVLALPAISNDSQIKANIMAKYTKDPIVNPFNIRVEVDKGNVTLHGTVNTDIEFEKAVILAAASNGVRDVNADNLSVKKSSSYIQDTLITAKVKGLLLRHKILKGNDVKLWSITVETKDSVVYLAGTVDNLRQKKNIIKIARSVKNVSSIKEDLNITK